MKRKTFFVVVILLLVASLFASSCTGIPQEVYDDVVKARDLAQEEVSSLRPQLDAAQTTIDNLQSDLETSQEQVRTLGSDFEVTQEQLKTLEEDLGTVQEELKTLQAEHQNAKRELAEIKEIYPPQDFTSLSELEDWLRANDVSERPIAEFAEGWYRKALEIQEDALKDGYIVSVDYDYDEKADLCSVFCVAIIDGELWWWDPETDEAYQDYTLGKLK